MRLCNVDGIEFFKGVPANTRIIAPASVYVHGDIDDVKRRLARHAKAVGADSVVDFRLRIMPRGFLSRLLRRRGRMFGQGLLAAVKHREWLSTMRPTPQEIP